MKKLKYTPPFLSRISFSRISQAICTDMGSEAKSYGYATASYCSTGAITGQMCVPTGSDVNNGSNCYNGGSANSGSCYGGNTAAGTGATCGDGNIAKSLCYVGGLISSGNTCQSGNTPES